MLVPISLDRLCPSTSTTAKVSRHPKLCHPDRSVAQWRDLQFNFRAQRKSRGRVSGFRFAINANGSRYALSKNTSGEALGREGELQTLGFAPDDKGGRLRSPQQQLSRDGQSRWPAAAMPKETRHRPPGYGRSPCWKNWPPGKSQHPQSLQVVLSYPLECGP
jgi:hypothetical protein